MSVRNDGQPSQPMHNPQHWYEYGMMRAPGMIRMALEWRAAWEYGASLAAQPLLRSAPEGDGHPVIVYPGLLASDTSTRPLRRFLESMGYVAYGWDLGSNRGPQEGVLSACRAQLQSVRKRHQRKASLLGWSLGGIYARELGKQLPKLVRQVITMGTPFTGHPKATNAWRLYEFVTGHKVGGPEIHQPLRTPPSVPTTSIYSRTDGIVAWQCCVEKASPLHENIEVEASHFGIGLNPLSWYAVADRLAQPEGRWQHFHRRGARAWFYRDPTRKGWY